VFQRRHLLKKFEGIDVVLANVRRHRRLGGDIGASAEPDREATFFLL
jgi:hypothetical protein